MRPGVARQYLHEVAAEFEAYAEHHYLPALLAREPDPDLVVAGLRYVATRRVPGRLGAVYEILTSPWPFRVKREIDEACLEAILATAPDRAEAARFLARVATGPRRVPSARLYEDALRRLGPGGVESLLDEMAAPAAAERRVRAAARLLLRISDVRPPEPMRAWVRGDGATRAAAVARWRHAITAYEGLVDDHDWTPDDDPGDGGEDPSELDDRGR